MSVIASRYAHALADLAAKGLIDSGRLRRELADLTATLDGSPALRGVLSSPAVTWDKKRALLDAVALRSGVSRIARNFLVVAAQRGRIGQLDAIDRAFDEILLAQAGMVRTHVVSARELDPAERQALERRLAALVGRQLQTDYSRDPALLGGFTARVGDKVYDGSIRGRLTRLRQALAAQ